MHTTRPTMRLLVLLLAGLFLAEGVSPSSSWSVPSAVGVASSPVTVTAMAGQGEQTAPACDSADLACSMDENSAPAPCAVPAGCAAGAVLPGGHSPPPTALPMTRVASRSATPPPASIFLERHTPPPRA